MVGLSSYSAESGRRADADRIIEIIRRATARIGARNPDAELSKSLSWDSIRDRRHVREKFQKFAEAILPGFGELGDARDARSDCGDPHPFLCDSCGHATTFGRTCSMSVCARCAQAWVRDRSIKKAAKVRRVRKEKHQHTPANEHQKIHHVVLGARPGWYYDLAKAGYSMAEAQELTREVVKEILDELRAQGVLVRHSFRGARDDGSIKEETDDRGQWKQRLFSGREWYDDVREQLAWKPHYHAVVVSDWIKGEELTKRVEAETGWIIARIAGDDGISLANDGAMARAVTYSISHTDVMVREGNNRSAVWEVGSFEGDPIKSSGRFTPHPADYDWADATVREYASRVLGLASGTTDCGATLPAVDDPDELARRIIEDLYPQDEGRRPSADAVLYHVLEGNIRVDVSRRAGGGGDVTVRDAFGEPVGEGGIEGNLPDAPGGTIDVDAPVALNTLDEDDDDGDDCDHDHDEADADEACTGTLIPLGEARQRGLLKDVEWCRQAPHVDEAREYDREWDKDLDPWRTSSPGSSISGIG